MGQVCPRDWKPQFDDFLKVLRCEVPRRPTLGEMFVGWTPLQHAAGFEWDKADPLGLIRLYVAGHWYGFFFGNDFTGPWPQRPGLIRLNLRWDGEEPAFDIDENWVPGPVVAK